MTEIEKLCSSDNNDNIFKSTLEKIKNKNNNNN